MCRHLAYLGSPIGLADLVVEAPHALTHQARQARFQSSGTMNPHGYGVAWYEHRGAAPRRYRTSTPIWEDPELDGLAATVHAPVLLAAVRLASPGSPVEVSGNAPFVTDGFAWSLNGVVDGWHEGVGDTLRGLVSSTRGAGIEGVTDAETLFALALDRLDAGASAPEALTEVVSTVEAHTSGRLNLLLTDGHVVAATACGNSLFLRPDAAGGLVASEPLDTDPRWARLPDRTLVTVSAGATTCTGL